MNTTTDARPTDEAMIAYAEWLQLSVVQDACDDWRHGPRGDAGVSFAAYPQALDLAERPALEYAGSSSVGRE